MQAYLRHGKEGVGGIALLHEALQVMLHELHHHEHIIQLLANYHLPHQRLTSSGVGSYRVGVEKSIFEQKPCMCRGLYL